MFNKYYKYILLFISVFVFQISNAGEIIKAKDGSTIIRLKVVGLPSPTATSTLAVADREVLHKFIENFPKIFKEKYAKLYRSDPVKYGYYNWDNVSIQLDAFSGIQVAGVENDLLAIAGNMAPDILYINCRKSNNYIMNGFLYPLDTFINRLPLDERKKFIKERVHEKLLPVIRRKGANGEKHIWCLPYTNTPSGKALFYRKDLFDKHNIPYPNNKWTWEDMYETCKKVTDPSKGIYGISFGKGKDESWYWINYLWSAGGEVMVEQTPGSNDWICTFGSKAGVIALDYYTKLSAEKWIDKHGIIRRGYAYKDPSSKAKWLKGEIAMSLVSVTPDRLINFNSEVFGIAPLPIGPTGKRGGELNSAMSGIFGGIKNQVILDAAWEYLYYSNCDEALKVKTEIMVDGGMGHFLAPEQLKKFGYDYFTADPSYQSMIDLYELSLDDSHPEPYGKNSNFAYNQMSIPLQKAEALALQDKLSLDKETRMAELAKILQQAEDEANEVMIGKISAKERSFRRTIAWIVLICIVITFFFVFKKIFKIFTPPKQTIIMSEKRNDFKKYIWAYILLLPAIMTILTWNYLPLARGSIMAFQEYKVLGNSIFVGVDNFGDLLVNKYWWESLWNALRYSLLVMSLTFLPPIILAILLQEVPKGKLLFRTIFYLPAVISGLVTMILWKQFYEPSEFGVLNQIILNIPSIGFIAIGAILLWICIMFAKRLFFYHLFFPMSIFILIGIILFFSMSALSFPVLFPRGEGFNEITSNFIPRLFQANAEPYRWLFNSNTAMVACVIPTIWAGMGPGCLIYLAALKGIPDDYYEAADIDGATFIDKILFVVFPTLKALIIINFVGVFISSWYSSTANILVMTGGDTVTKTETAGLYIWYKAFTYLDFGPATAAAWMLAFFLIGFTIYQLKMLANVEFRANSTKK